MIAHEAAGHREFLPLAEAHLHTRRPGRAKLRFEARFESRDNIICAGAVDGGNDSGFIIEPGQITNPDGMPSLEVEAEEVLKSAGQARAPFVGPDASKLPAVDQDAARVGRVHPAE